MSIEISDDSAKIPSHMSVWLNVKFSLTSDEVKSFDWLLFSPALLVYMHAMFDAHVMRIEINVYYWNCAKVKKLTKLNLNFFFSLFQRNFTFRNKK